MHPGKCRQIRYWYSELGQAYWYSELGQATGKCQPMQTLGARGKLNILRRYAGMEGR